ncbi:MAG: alpha/beta hydrolase [Rhodospirillaceae bacterium]|nr:alpha/beta hydrolase [Rhodospirillaceae bacterium]
MVSRRAFLAGVGALAGPAFGAEPKVYLDYTATALDQALDQQRYAPNWLDIVKELGRRSDAAIKAAPPVTQAYGDDPDEALDIYGAGKLPNAPVLLFIHGGGWRMMDKKDLAYAAQTFVSAGILFVSVGYSLIAKAPVRTMATQCSRAVAWMHENAGRFGGNPDSLHLSGQSAGAHLAGVVIADPELIKTGALKSATLISGIYDTAALAASSVYGYTNLSPEDVTALSPSRYAGRIGCPATVVWAAKEPPEFKRQSVEFVRLLQAAGRPCRGLEVPDRTHFELAFDLAEPGSALSRAALATIAENV